MEETSIVAMDEDREGCPGLPGWVMDCVQVTMC